MKRLLYLLLFSVLSISFSTISQADVVNGEVGRYVQPDGVNIVPNRTPLEIMGGSQIRPNQQCETGFETIADIFVSLDQETLDQLTINVVNQALPTPQQVQQILFPTVPNVFGLARNMLTQGNGTNWGSFINAGGTNGGELTALRITGDPDGLLEAERFRVNADFNEFDNYGESSVAPRSPQPLFGNADPCVGGCNTTDGSFDIYCSEDDGLFWFFDPNNIDEVLCALDGGTIASFGPISTDRFWVFYGATTNVEYTLTITDTVSGVSREVDTDVPAAGFDLADSCGVSTDSGNAVMYRNRRDQEVKVVTFDNDFGRPGGEDPKVHIIDDDPNFTNFYGFGCTLTPGNPNGTDAAFTWIGGRVDIDFVGPDGEPIIVRSRAGAPATNSNFGPAAMNAMCNAIPIFADGFEAGDTTSWSQTNESMFYAQFLYGFSEPVPTLSEWGLIALSVVLLAFGLVVLRRRKIAINR